MPEVMDFEKTKVCSTSFVLALNDTMNVISGKWKLPIIGSLLFGKRRFREMSREIPGITPRMLSKELKDLEINGIVRRTVYDTIPVSVEYELTQSGELLREVLEVMVKWGLRHRKAIMGKGARTADVLAA
jgi:DNA-binding HxlR family transcriptional regulator